MTDYKKQQYLYRGVSEKVFEMNRGKLSPKGDSFEYTFKANGSVKADGRATAGPSKQNATYGHHITSSIHCTFGISTSFSIKVAKKFATSTPEGKPTNGYIYRIDRFLLSKNKVEEHIHSDPLYPNEKEVTLVAENNSVISDDVIDEIIFVSN
jgi:hypothetical protein